MSLFYPTCQGNCRKHPGHHRIFCDACWKKLPDEHKQALMDAYQGDADQQPTAFYDKLGEARDILYGVKGKA